MNEKQSMYIVAEIDAADEVVTYDGIDAARKASRELALKHPGREMIVFRAVESATSRAEPLVLKNFSR